MIEAIFTGFKEAVQFSACGAKGLGVSSKEVVDKCPPEMESYTDLCSMALVLILLYLGAKKIYQLCRWIRRWRICVRAANAIAKRPYIAAYLVKMTRKDAKFQVNNPRLMLHI